MISAPMPRWIMRLMFEFMIKKEIIGSFQTTSQLIEEELSSAQAAV